MFARLIGTGGYLPEKIVTNDDLAQSIDTSHEKIVELSGIHSRHIAGDQENSITMAVQAAQQAIQSSDIDPSEIDLVLIATCTPVRKMPSVACDVQRILGLKRGIPAFDLNAACSGFIYGAVLADQFIRAQTARCVLVIGSDKMSEVIDWNDRSTCILFGDGAGAAIFKADTRPGILSTYLGGDGHYAGLLYTAPQPDQPGKEMLQMSGREVFKNATKTLERLVDDVLLPVGLCRDDIDWLVPHQANLRIIRMTAKLLDLPMERVINTIDHHANTSAASIPLALDCACRRGQIKLGEHVLLEAFGAGFTWGSLVLQY